VSRAIGEKGRSQPKSKKDCTSWGTNSGRLASKATLQVSGVRTRTKEPAPSRREDWEKGKIFLRTLGTTSTQEGQQEGEKKFKESTGVTK